MCYQVSTVFGAIETIVDRRSPERSQVGRTGWIGMQVERSLLSHFRNKLGPIVGSEITIGLLIAN